jgi:hypothetical protein
MHLKRDILVSSLCFFKWVNLYHYDEELRTSLAGAHLRGGDGERRQRRGAADETGTRGSGGDTSGDDSDASDDIAGGSAALASSSTSPVAALLHLRDADVLDLGTGTGLAGLAAAAAGARSVTMTDNLDSVVDLCERNRRANPSLRARTRAVNHCWGEPVPPPQQPKQQQLRNANKKTKTTKTNKGVDWDVEQGGAAADGAAGGEAPDDDAVPLLDSVDGVEGGGGGGGSGGSERKRYGLVLAIDCMHCAARTGGVERFPLATTLEDACAPDGACILAYEPRGFAWNPVDEPFVARVEAGATCDACDVTHPAS